jgi:tetratricopeptide (TPR) repeat protein
VTALAAFAVVGLVGPVVGGGPAKPPSPLSAFTKRAEGPEEIVRRWEVRRNAASRGDLESARREVEAVHQLRLDLGITSLNLHALALLREARDAIRASNPKRAIDLVGQAQKLAPHLPDGEVSAARAHFAEDTFALGAIFGSLYKAATLTFESPRHRDTYLANAIVVFGLTCLCAVLTFLLLQLLRYVRFLRHDFGDLLRIGPIPSGVLLAVVLALPVIFGIAPLGVVLLWGTVFFFYQKTSERVVSLVCLSIAALMPLLIHLAAPFFVVQSQMGIDLAELGTGYPPAEVLERAEGRVRRNPDEFELTFLLARLRKSRGEDEAAEKLYKQALVLKERHPALLNNYANFLVITGRASQAVSYYENALKHEPKLAVAQYNLAQCHRHLASKGIASSLEKHAHARQLAEDLDPVAVKGFQAIETNNRNRYIIDAPLSDAEVHARAQRAVGSIEVLSAQMWERFAEWLPLKAAPWVPLGLIALLGIFWIARLRTRVAFACEHCEGTACTRCYPELSAGRVCHQCHDIFLRGTAIDAKLRLEREAQIHRHQTRRRRIRVALSAILMGSGQILAGRAGRGFVLVCLFFFLLFEFLFWNGIVRYPLGVDATPSLARGILLGLTFVPAYLIGLAGVLRK